VQDLEEALVLEGDSSEMSKTLKRELAVMRAKDKEQDKITQKKMQGFLLNKQ